MTWDPSYAAEQQAAYRRQLVSTTFIPNPVDVDTGTYSPTISMNGLYYPSVSASLSSSSESTSLQSPTSSSRSSAGLYSHGQLFDCRPPAENTWQPSNSGTGYMPNINPNIFGFSTSYSSSPLVTAFDQFRTTTDVDSDPPSPLRAVTPVIHEMRRRRTSDATEDNVPSGHKRRRTWTAGPNEGPNVSQAQKAREIHELECLAGGDGENQKERRKIQNRFAQRAFRARSKVKSSKDMNRLEHLEEASETHDELVHSLRQTLSARDEEILRLQKENDALRSAQWVGYSAG